MLTIPRVAYQTTNFSLAVVPDLWGEASSGFQFVRSNNAEIAQDMHHFSREVSAIFDCLSGIHQANLWHATMIYRHGGLYLDIKTIGIEPLQQLIPEHHDRPTMYAVTSRLHGTTHIHIGIMAATPRHPLMKEWLDRLLKGGIQGEMSQYRPNLMVCFSLYTILQKHFGLPSPAAALGDRARPGLYESATGGRLILWEERSDAGLIDKCRWRHTGYRPMRDRYGKCQLIFNTSSERASPVMGFRDPTYPMSWAKREVNLSLGRPLNFDPRAQAPLSTVIAGDGFSTMDKNLTRELLDGIKSAHRNHSSLVYSLKVRLKSKTGKHHSPNVTDFEELRPIVAEGRALSSRRSDGRGRGGAVPSKRL